MRSLRGGGGSAAREAGRAGGERRAPGGGGLPRQGVGAPRGDRAEPEGAPRRGLGGCGVEVGVEFERNFGEGARKGRSLERDLENSFGVGDFSFEGGGKVLRDFLVGARI